MIKPFVISSLFFLSIFYFQITNNQREGHFVVVGAYSVNKEFYAKRYQQILLDKNKKAHYGYSASKNLYFVYLDYSKNFDEAIMSMRSLRKEDGFSDAWVYVGALSSPEFQKEVSDVSEEMNTDTETPEDFSVNQINESEERDTQSLPTSEQLQATDNEVPVETRKEVDIPKTTSEVENLNDLKIRFNLFNATTGESIPGEVQVIDEERVSLLQQLSSDTTHFLKDPNNRTGDILLIAEVFGFRKDQKLVNFYSPFSQDSVYTIVNLEEGIYEVDFDLVRYRKGDIVVMYNVFFFKDAAMMLPESRYQLNQLLEMMNENPDYRIKIHGHTNGNAPGKIITPGTDNNYFSLSESDEEGFGTAKKLSKERAELIKAFLVDNGVDPSRMEVKAWGGKRMLYDKLSSQADKNVRVEIEILEE